MYRFLVHPKDNKISFLDKDDEEMFNNIIRDASNKGLTLEVTINVASKEKKSLTENQKSLWRFLISEMAKYSGDTYSDMENHILTEVYGVENSVSVSDLRNSEFDELIINTVQIANKMNMKLEYNELKGRFEW